MRKLDHSHEAYKFLSDLAAKQYRQVGQKMLALLANPQPYAASQLRGYDGYWRTDIGEYRIIYRFDDETVYVILIGKRNDDEVYKQLGQQ